MSITRFVARAGLLALGLGWLPSGGGSIGSLGSPDRLLASPGCSDRSLASSGCSAAIPVVAAATPGSAPELPVAAVETFGSSPAIPVVAAATPGSARALMPVELATVGVDVAEGMPTVLLREPRSGRILPILVGVPEAQSILGVMLGLQMPRPMTHDLLASVIHGLGATVEEVLVHDLRGSTYVGTVRLRIEGEETLRDIDSRPSDALALAVRTGAPILVSEELLVEPPPFDLLVPEEGEQVVRIMGATVVAPTPTLRDRYQLPRRAGVVVVGVSGEAAERGIRHGDLILEVNGQGLRQPMDFLEAARATGDEPVRVRYWRQGEEHEVELQPQALPGRGPRRAPAIRV